MMLQTAFTDLANPSYLNMGLALLLATIMVMILWAGMRLKSPAVFVIWALTSITLIFTFVTQFSFIWFWVMVMLSLLLISIVASIRYTL
ncbi:hypothetical protein [His 1 virus]|uniref:Putative transmembrane protein ORF24 n=1 Tax=His1 virus (isolate Australia/Victoria) TaxID=654912 RepID=Y024_HIS1I|nr:hypothetical protein His1V_gp24 [His 1 virus]Q25BH1.1 RecName: Full=Putative transmembrane protein ORF24 [His1 virus (isolate Victoria)]AAQ13740.1 hypothetical protein [His 1 virus]